ncbi:MAG: phosphoglycolate phosphatase [Arenicellales bacterium]|jgi:phosphoglycolate phosphatase
MKDVAATGPLSRDNAVGAWPRAVLFDLDGTLVDTGPDISAAINRMLADMGRPHHPPARIMQWVGEGGGRLVRRALAGGLEGEDSVPEGDFERGFDLFHRHYAEGICDRSQPYPNARRILGLLRECRVGVGCVTNKPERLARRLFDALRLTDSFEVIVGGDTLETRKPRPEPIHYACRHLRVSPEDAVYIGDSVTDCRAAEAAGMGMVAVSYGYNRGLDLTKEPCMAIIDDLDELPSLLNQIRQ